MTNTTSTVAIELDRSGLAAESAVRTAILADPRSTGTVNDDYLRRLMNVALDHEDAPFIPEPATTPSDSAEQVLESAEPEEEPERKTMWALKEARKHYVTVSKSNGGKSTNCGDGLASLLLDLLPNEVALLADRVLEEADGFHQAKYAHLNPGQVRMNSGNRIRSAFKRGDVTEEDVEDALFKALFEPTESPVPQG